MIRVALFGVIDQHDGAYIGPVRDHKSLLAWQKARAVMDGVVEVSINHWSPSAGPIISQLQRSALSTQLNIAEGYARHSTRQFRYHLNVAYGSAVETIELLELLRDHALVPADLAARILANALDTRGLLMGLLRRYAKLSPPDDAPHSSLLTPHSSLLTPHSSLSRDHHRQRGCAVHLEPDPLPPDRVARYPAEHPVPAGLIGLKSGDIGLAGLKARLDRAAHGILKRRLPPFRRQLLSLDHHDETMALRAVPVHPRPLHRPAERHGELHITMVVAVQRGDAIGSAG